MKKESLLLCLATSTIPFPPSSSMVASSRGKSSSNGLNNGGCTHKVVQDNRRPPTRTECTLDGLDIRAGKHAARALSSRCRGHGALGFLLGSLGTDSAALGELRGVDLVVLEEPFHELPQAGVEGGGGVVPEVARGVADVGVRERHVAVARHGDDAFVRFLAEELLEDGHHAGDGHRRGVAEVVDAEGRRPALLAGLGARALTGRVERTEAPLHDVVDVGEVAAHVCAVGGAEERDGLAGDDAAGEGEVGHVGASPRTVHREEAEAGDGETVDVVVRVRDGLPGLLGGRVQRRRSVRAVVLGEWRVSVEPVHRRRRRPHDRRLRVGVPGGGLEDADEARDVGGHVRLRRPHRVPHAGLRGEVQHVREGHDGEEPLEQGRVVDVGAEHHHPARREQPLPRALQGRLVVGVEVVEAEHAVAARPERQRAVRAHEPRSARDQHRHPPVPPRRGAPPHLPLPRGARVRRRRPEQVPVPRRLPRRGRRGGGGGEPEGAGEEGRVVHGEEADERERGEDGGAEEEVRGRRDDLGGPRAPHQQRGAAAGVPLELDALGGRVHTGRGRRRRRRVRHLVRTLLAHGLTYCTAQLRVRAGRVEWGGVELVSGGGGGGGSESEL
ncbi:hypothetical protein VPH35_122912 [Triticum aestivum]